MAKAVSVRIKVQSAWLVLREASARRKKRRAPLSQRRATSSQAGFTLLEMTLVILIVESCSASRYPAFSTPIKRSYASKLRGLQNTFAWCAAKRVLKQTTYDLHLTSTARLIWVTSEDGIDTQFAKDFGLLGRGVRVGCHRSILDKVAVDITDVSVLGEGVAQALPSRASIRRARLIRPSSPGSGSLTVAYVDARNCSCRWILMS